MHYNFIISSGLVTALGTAGATAVDILAISAILNKLIDFVRAWIPDRLEGKYLMPIAIGLGIGLCFLAKMPIMEAITQGMVYGLGAAGMAGGQKAVEESHNGNTAEQSKKEAGKPID